jgi:hypothetical protein
MHYIRPPIQSFRMGQAVAAAALLLGAGQLFESALAKAAGKTDSHIRRDIERLSLPD